MKSHLGVHFRLITNTNSRLCKCRPVMKHHRFSSSASLESMPKPNVPLRIKREPTDILKALASTVNQLPTTGPAYKFYDDPYLYPYSLIEKNSYLLSMESGKKAARYIRDTYPQYFNHHPDDPIIQELAPKTHFDENSDVSEKDLCNCIQNLQVSDAEKVYRLCQAKNIEVGAETRQSLLELISFYNGEDVIHPDWTAERASMMEPRLPRPVQRWTDSGFAEELFESLKDDTKFQPYGALIKGMCKYHQAERAWQLFEESLGKGMTPDVGTFNAILTVCNLLRDDHDARWNLALDILKQMAEKDIKPNLGTLNAILEALLYMRRSEQAKNLSLRVLAEFKQLNIKPSLASYYFLLGIFYVPNKAVSSFLPRLLDEIEHMSFTIEDPRDVLFFCNAMLCCNRDLQSFQVAHRLMEMSRRGKNIDLVGQGSLETSFYRNYINLATDALPMSEFMEIYDKLVPHVFSLERDVATKIVQSIGVHDAVEYLPRIWSDAVMMKQSRGERLMEVVLMVANRHDVENASTELRERLVNVAWDIWNRVQELGEAESKKKDIKDTSISWSGQMLGDCIAVIVRGGDIKKAVAIARFVIETDLEVIGEIPIEAIKFFYDAVINEKLYSEAMMIMKYVKENEYPEAFELGKQLNEVSDLPDSVKMRLNSMFKGKFEV